jgi:hypothetical protein
MGAWADLNSFKTESNDYFDYSKESLGSMQGR